MKFPLAQEVSRHVRDKVCKFYSNNDRKIVQSSPTCTVTSNETQKSSLISPDSIKLENMASSVNEKVPESLSRLVVEQSLELIENNFTDILSPSSFTLTSTGNETEENEFGMIIGELGDAGDEEIIVEVCFKCKLCDFSSNSHAEFLFHETLHQLPIDQDSRQKIQCQICKKFFGKTSLREHLRQHTNERIFECPVDGCPMRFTRKANLRNHIINVHKNDTDNATPLNVCQICGKKFQSK